MIIFRHGVASQINALPGPDPKPGRALLNQRTIIYFLGYRSKHVFESVLNLLCNCPSTVQSLFCVPRWEPIVPNLSREKWLPRSMTSLFKRRQCFLDGNISLDLIFFSSSRTASLRNYPSRFISSSSRLIFEKP